MNSLFAFQTKYAKQNVVLTIIDAKRYIQSNNTLNINIYSEFNSYLH
jgi:hypothetical protein